MSAPPFHSALTHFALTHFALTHLSASAYSSRYVYPSSPAT